jgi:hypothetical protein
LIEAYVTTTIFSTNPTQTTAQFYAPVEDSAKENSVDIPAFGVPIDIELRKGMTLWMLSGAGNNVAQVFIENDAVPE